MIAALLTVCVLQAGAADEAAARLKSIGAEVRMLEVGGSLDGCRIAVLPSEWTNKPLWNDLAPTLRGLTEWVRAGHGLLVFQPNPHHHDDRLTIDLLDAPFTVENFYEAGEGSVRLADHPVLEGIDDSELPFPADKIVSYENGPWTALARGAESQAASLLVGEFACGRAAVDTDNPTCPASNCGTTKSVHSDKLLRQLLEWLADGSCNDEIPSS